MKKTALAFILAAFLTTGLAHAAYAYGFEVFNDYFNADGTCSYYFEQGITVTMPEEWYQNRDFAAEHPNQKWVTDIS